MSRRILVAFIIAVVAVGAAVFYIVAERQVQPFTPPLGDDETERALAELLKNDPELKTLSSWVEVSPKDAAARGAFGSALLARGFYAHAKEQLTEAVALNPNDGVLHRDLGTALSELDEDGAAVEHFEKAVLLNPNDPAAYNNLGHGYIRLNRLQEAVAVWEQAVELDPGFAPTRVNLGLALLELRRINEALEQLRTAGMLAPDLPTVPYALASLWASAGDVDSTLFYLDKGVQMAPEYFKQVVSSQAFNAAKADQRFMEIRQKSDRLLRRRTAGTQG